MELGASAGVDPNVEAFAQRIYGLPSFKAAATGAKLPAFQGFSAPLGIPELGIENIPAPFQSSASFQTLYPSEQSQLLDLWVAAGLQPEDIMKMIEESTVGFRRYRPTSYSLAA